MDPPRNERFSTEPAQPQESGNNFSSGLLAVFLATSVTLLTVVVLSFLTLNYFLPVLLIGGGIFFMAGFHYLVWGWWLTSTITAEELEEEESFPGSPAEGKEYGAMDPRVSLAESKAAALSTQYSPAELEALLRETVLFRPSTLNLVAGFILAAIFSAGGVVMVCYLWREAYLAGGNLPVWAERGMSWGGTALGTLLGIVALAGGLFLCRLSLGLVHHCVSIGPHGIRIISETGVEEIKWQSVDSLAEEITYHRLPLLKGLAKYLLPELPRSTYVIRTTGGDTHAFGGTFVGDLPKFKRLLQLHAHRAGIRWETIDPRA